TLANRHGVGAVGDLTRTEHVEVAQADGRQAIAAGENVRVQLVHVFGDGVGRQRSADDVLDFGQPGMVAVNRAARRVNEAFHFVVAGGDQHVDGAGQVACV